MVGDPGRLLCGGHAFWNHSPHVSVEGACGKHERKGACQGQRDAEPLAASVACGPERAIQKHPDQQRKGRHRREDVVVELGDHRVEQHEGRARPQCQQDTGAPLSLMRLVTLRQQVQKGHETQWNKPDPGKRAVAELRQEIADAARVAVNT